MAGPYSLNPQSNYGLQLPQNLSSMGEWGMPADPMAGLGLQANAANTFGMPQGIGTTAQIAPPDVGLFAGINNWMKDSGFLGSTDASGMKTNGWGGMALGAIQGLGSAYMGMKQYGLAKDAFNENKRQFQMNYDAQKTTTNSALEDRQRARVASNSGAYESVGNYMDRNGVK